MAARATAIVVTIGAYLAPGLATAMILTHGRWEREDIEVITPHYRGAHGASVARSVSEQMARWWHELNEFSKAQKAQGVTLREPARRGAAVCAAPLRWP